MEHKLKIFFATFGCKVNSSEDEFFLSKALEMGYGKALSAENADVIVINGCAVTETAYIRCKDYIHKISAKNPHAKLIVTGCISAEIKREKSEYQSFETIDNSNKNAVIASLAGAIGYAEHTAPLSSFCGGLPDRNGYHTRAFFKIQDGCDACCSYCIIPTLRGAPASKPIEEAVKEFTQCVEKGFKEIVLVGIHIGLYGKGYGYGLIDLVKRLLKTEGDFRIRLSSVEVNEIGDELIDLVGENEKLCNHLHIPLQSGSGKILRAMGRKYSPEKYIDTVAKAKNAIKNLTVGSDIIVGFPSETENDFQDTIKTLHAAGTDFLHVFPYSDRRGTAASIMENKVDEHEKMRRSKILRNIAEETLLGRYEKSIGQTYRILTEKNNKGHTDNYLQVHIESETPIIPNVFGQIRITRTAEKKLFCSYFF